MALLFALCAGTFLISLAYAGGRANSALAHAAFWIGEVGSFAAVSFGVLSEPRTYRARLVLVLALGAQQVIRHLDVQSIVFLISG